MDNYELKLQELREKYKTAPASIRSIIIRQARCIQIAMEKKAKRLQNTQTQLEILAKDGDNPRLPTSQG